MRTFLSRKQLPVSDSELICGESLWWEESSPADPPPSSLAPQAVSAASDPPTASCFRFSLSKGPPEKEENVEEVLEFECGKSYPLLDFEVSQISPVQRNQQPAS